MATATRTRPGRRSLLATQHVRDGDVVWIVVGSPRMNTWWRHFRDGAPVVLRLAGEEVHGWAVALDGAEHPEEVAAGLSQYLAAHPDTVNLTAARADRSSAQSGLAELTSHTVMVRVELDADPV